MGKLIIVPPPAPALARTPLHHWHTARGARFVERDGWQVAVSYSDTAHEVAAARAGLGLADLSAFAKISVRGGSLAQKLREEGSSLGPHRVAALDVGTRALACRLTEDHWLFLALTTNAASLHAWFDARNRESPNSQQDVRSSYALFSLLGSSTEKALRCLTALDLNSSAFPGGSCAETSLAGVHAVLIHPPEIALGEVLIAVAWDLGEYIWEQLLEAGRSHGIAPVGLDAWQILTSAKRTGE
ncbi:MAG TPA: hypothetical protein VKU02_26455 [Gemmataceae bacterium]|nr:hypothetical protein [Gemmataceae bacterium]